MWIYLGVVEDLVERPGFRGTHSIHCSSFMGPPPWLEHPLNHSMPPTSQADLFIGHPRNAVPPSLSPCATRFLLGLEHLRSSHKTTVCWNPRPAQPEEGVWLWLSSQMVAGYSESSPSFPPQMWPSDILDTGALFWTLGFLRAPEVDPGLPKPSRFKKPSSTGRHEPFCSQSALWDEQESQAGLAEGAAAGIERNHPLSPNCPLTVRPRRTRSC